MWNAECGFGPSSLREFLGSQFSVQRSAFSIPKLPMFPINLSITRVNKHTQTVWSFFMIPQSGPRPEFKAGQVAILKINDCADAYMAFASAPEEDEFEFLVKHSAESPKGSAARFGPQTDRLIVLKNIVGHGFAVRNCKGEDLG